MLGIDTNWMTMPESFRTIYIASGIWQTAGWASIMYTAALSNASKDLEEAAIVDGANILQQIWYVELPAIKKYYCHPVYFAGRKYYEHWI